MLIVYDSLTGQTKRFASNLGFPSVHIKLYEYTHDEPILLVTRSINFGDIPETTKTFLDQYHNLVVGVAVSGNKNWGENFGKAGEKIEALYQIPLIVKFEGSGIISDRLLVKDWLIKKIGKEE